MLEFSSTVIPAPSPYHCYTNLNCKTMHCKTEHWQSIHCCVTVGWVTGKAYIL